MEIRGWGLGVLAGTDSARVYDVELGVLEVELSTVASAPIADVTTYFRNCRFA